MKLTSEEKFKAKWIIRTACHHLKLYACWNPASIDEKRLCYQSVMAGMAYVHSWQEFEYVCKILARILHVSALGEG